MSAQPVDVLAVLRRYKSADARAAAERLDSLLDAMGSLLASHCDYTESQKRGWPVNPAGYPDLEWSLAIETGARAALARCRGAP